MAVFYAIIQESRQNCGRNSNRTYHDVLDRVSNHGAATWAEFIAAVTPPPGEHFMQITEAEFHNFRSQDPAWERYQDGHGNLPRWAVDRTSPNFPTPGSVYGSYANPENRNTAFTQGVPNSDPRWRLRIYSNPQRTQHIAQEDVAEDDPSIVNGRITRYIKLFNANDTPSNTNAQDTKATVGNINMIFDWASGESDFFIKVDDGSGTVIFPSNGRYRVVGPADEKEVRFEIYTRTIRIER